MLYKALLFDLARTILFPIDKDYKGGINDLHNKLSHNPAYKLNDYFELDPEMIAYLKSIKSSIPLYMFTSESIQNDPAIKEEIFTLFRKVYSAKEMGVEKTDPNAYKLICSDLKLQPSDVLFIDDSVHNIDAAKTAGLPVIQYINNGVITKLKDIL